MAQPLQLSPSRAQGSREALLSVLMCVILFCCCALWLLRALFCRWAATKEAVLPNWESPTPHTALNTFCRFWCSKAMTTTMTCMHFARHTSPRSADNRPITRTYSQCSNISSPHTTHFSTETGLSSVACCSTRDTQQTTHAQSASFLRKSCFHPRLIADLLTAIRSTLSTTPFSPFHQSVLYPLLCTSTSASTIA